MYDISDIKMLLGITDNLKDNLIQYLADAAESQVKAYCRRNDETENMKSVINSMAIRQYRGGQFGQEIPDDKVSSVKEGDVTIQLKGSGYNPSTSLMDDEKKALYIDRCLFK